MDEWKVAARKEVGRIKELQSAGLIGPCRNQSHDQHAYQTGNQRASHLLRSDYAASVYHMSWDYHVIMMSLVPDYSTTFHTTSHSDSYYYRD
jgi:hypothetical protein